MKVLQRKAPTRNRQNVSQKLPDQRSQPSYKLLTELLQYTHVVYLYVHQPCLEQLLRCFWSTSNHLRYSDTSLLIWNNEYDLWEIIALPHLVRLPVALALLLDDAEMFCAAVNLKPVHLLDPQFTVTKLDIRIRREQEVAIWLTTTDGTLKRFRFYGRTQAEVRTQVTEARAKEEQGIPRAKKSWHVGEYLDYWLEHGVRSKRRPLTYRRSETIVRLYLKPGLKKHTVGKLSVHTVQLFLDQLHSCGTSPSTVHQIRKVLSAALTWAVRKELLARNVARLVELPRYKPKEAAHWNVAEVQMFLNAIQEEPLQPLFILLTFYGLRSAEGRGIRWCDVDWQNEQLHIRQQVQRIDCRMQQVDLKTDSSYRDEPLLSTVKAALQKQRRWQAKARMAATESWQGTGDENELVFTTRTGRPIEARNVYRSFQRILMQHNLRRITLHGLRHSNATAQKTLDVPARDTQAILGHSDIRTTAIYTHVDVESKRAALERVEQKLIGDESEVSRQLSRQSLAGNFATDSSSHTKKTPTSVGWVLSLVDPTRGNWNCVFECVEKFCERLDELDIEVLMQTH